VGNFKSEIGVKSKIMVGVLLVLCTSLYAQVDFSKRLSDAAIELTQQQVQYDPQYFSIKYPNGDVPSDKGVCTDVIIRAYRKLGIDLQKEVHEDMLSNFNVYPKNWGLKKTDKNIDHRRVPNLMKYFSRHGVVKKISTNSDDYLPGDIVAWNLGGAITHIGFVVDKKSNDGKRNMIVHNIGAGQVLEDMLFTYKIIGHYSFKK
jgi:uncharacterized protein YijF (DUF1287 family)